MFTAVPANAATIWYVRLDNWDFENIYNIDGSFLGISEYEYFNDVTLNRDPIVTEYNFN